MQILEKANSNKTRKMGTKKRIRAVSKNFFLHFHSPRIHLYTLRPTFTFGLGVINISLFVILVLSGILLMIYYQPSITAAYASIQDIQHVVFGGRYIRNIHRWAAHGLVFFSMLHMARTFYTAAYTKNRKMTWNLGVGLLLVTLLASFTGYLLPWDQLGFWAVTIASNIVGSTRELTDVIGTTAFFDPGSVIKDILLGGSDVDQDALTRFYFLHIIFLPLIFALLTALHFWRIRKQGGLNLPVDADLHITESGNQQYQSDHATEAHTQIFTWPTALWAEFSIFITLLAILTLFAYLIDAPLKEPAHAAIPENPAKAPWYFLGVQELVSYSALGGGLLLPLMVIATLFFIPVLDREEKAIGKWFTSRQGLRITITSILLSFFSVILIMTLVIGWGWIRDWLPGAPHWLAIFINPGSILFLFYCLFAYIIKRRTQSTRMGVMALFTALTVAYILFTAIGIWFRGPDWQFGFCSFF